MRKSWLLAPIAFSAFVATWGGWVTLAKMTGFGRVNMLPGFVGDQGWATIDLSIALPVGVEAYGALALAVAFDRGARARARWFAGVSSLASLTLAAIGQAIVHNLESDGRTVAPGGVTSFVSVLPVVVLGMASALAVLSQGRVSETSQASRVGGMLGRLAEAATERAVSRLNSPVETSHEYKPGETSQEDTPDEIDVSAGQRLGTPRLTIVRAALDKDPETLKLVTKWLRETPRPTVDEIAGRLGTSRATAGRVATAARKSLISTNAHTEGVQQ